MTWFKVDDGFWSHPKVLRLSADAVALWVRAGSWCGNQLTDGVIPAEILPVLGAKKRAITELVFAGLWLITDDGYQFHDWADYQPSREEVLEERRRNADRQKRHRENLKAKRNAVTNPVTNPVSNGAPTRPDPTRPSSSTKKNEPAANRGSRVPRDFVITDEMRDWARTEVPLVNLDSKLSEWVDYWASVPGSKGVKLDWVATWRNGMRKQQEFAQRDTPATRSPRRVVSGRVQ